MTHATFLNMDIELDECRTDMVLIDLKMRCALPTEGSGLTSQYG